MKKNNIQFLLCFSLLIVFGCKKANVTQEMIEEAKVEQDSIIAQIEQPDTTVAEIVKADPKLAQQHEKSKDRIKEGLEKSEYKEVPCTHILDEFKQTVDDFCAKKISYDDLTKKMPDMNDTKVKLCIQKGELKKQYDAISNKLEGCLDDWYDTNVICQLCPRLTILNEMFNDQSNY